MNKNTVAKMLIIVILICMILFSAEVIKGLQLRREGDDYFTAKVTLVSAGKITFEITNSGTTPYEKGATLAVKRKNVTSAIPGRVLWDYIHVGCNCENDLIGTDPQEIPIVFYISKTDAGGNIIYD